MSIKIILPSNVNTAFQLDVQMLQTKIANKRERDSDTYRQSDMDERKAPARLINDASKMSERGRYTQPVLH